jgi:hypothetical protein
MVVFKFHTLIRLVSTIRKIGLQSLFLFFSIHCTSLFAQIQDFSLIKGTVYHQRNGEKLPYVNVYNLSQKTGVLSNENGFYQLENVQPDDSIRFSFVGFKTSTFTGLQLRSSTRVLLIPEFTEMKEVVVVADDESFLYDLVYSARRNMNVYSGKAKSYFELKSYHSDSQIELVQAYYGAELNGCDLKSLDLKTARFGLKPYENRFFVSHENAKAIAMNKLLTSTPYFPAQPFSFTPKRMRKEFSLILLNRYREENGDSVYVIRYAPRKTVKDAFNGEIWLNITRMVPRKMTLSGTTSTHHPFQPIFSVDSILQVQFSITRTFDIENSMARFRHVDFNINLTYKSSKPDLPTAISSIESHAVLYAYEYDTTFIQPYFKFNYLPDFRKFNAYPFRESFWEESREYGMEDSLDENLLFFKEDAILNSRNAFERNHIFSIGLYEHSFIHWSNKRFVIRKSPPKPDLKISQLKTERERYEINVELFLDLIPKGDSLSLFTSVMFDPYLSYYHFEQDSMSIAFYNMVLDLYEIQRRKSFPEQMIHHDQLTYLPARIQQFEEDMRRQKENYFKDVQRGHQIEEMKWYHRLIKKELGVLNLPEE